MKNGLVFGGLAIAGLSTLAGLLLPEAPSSIQTNPVIMPIGTFFINNQAILVLVGLVMIFSGLLFA